MEGERDGRGGEKEGKGWGRKGKGGRKEGKGGGREGEGREGGLCSSNISFKKTHAFPYPSPTPFRAAKRPPQSGGYGGFSNGKNF